MAEQVHPLWLVCICVRVAIGVFISKEWHGATYHLITLALAIVAAGFVYQYMTSDPSRPEYQIDKVWWNADRPVHAGFFAMAAIAHYVGAAQVAGSLVIANVCYSVVNRLATTL